MKDIFSVQRIPLSRAHLAMLGRKQYVLGGAFLVVMLLLIWHWRKVSAYRELEYRGAYKQKRLYPELDVMTDHYNGVSSEDIDETRIMLKNDVTPDQNYVTSLNTGDGLQMEGMESPIDQFERASLIRQDSRKPYFLAAMPSSADLISTHNI